MSKTFRKWHISRVHVYIQLSDQALADARWAASSSLRTKRSAVGAYYPRQDGRPHTCQQKACRYVRLFD